MSALEESVANPGKTKGRKGKGRDGSKGMAVQSTAAPSSQAEGGTVDPQSPVPVPGRGGGGLFASLRETMEEANELGRAQAIMLNKELEDRGVLEPIAPPAKKKTEEDKGGEGMAER